MVQTPPEGAASASVCRVAGHDLLSVILIDKCNARSFTDSRSHRAVNPRGICRELCERKLNKDPVRHCPSYHYISRAVRTILYSNSRFESTRELDSLEAQAHIWQVLSKQQGTNGWCRFLQTEQQFVGGGVA